jgi:hypothetical protein
METLFGQDFNFVTLKQTRTDTCWFANAAVTGALASEWWARR